MWGTGGLVWSVGKRLFATKSWVEGVLVVVVWGVGDGKVVWTGVVQLKLWHVKEGCGCGGSC